MRQIGLPSHDPAPETRRLYASDWVRFAVWCRQQALSALPTADATLLAYLLALAPDCGRGALGRHRSAIAAMHRERGHPVPVLDKQGRAALRAATPRPRRRRAARPTAGTLVRLALGAPRDLAGLRDRAMLLLLAAATEGDIHAATRASLLGLDVDHVRFTAAGAELLIRSRAEEERPGLRLAVARSAAAACPVRALEEWLLASGTAFGPLFRKVDRWGNAEHARLGSDAWRRILARRGGQPRMARLG